MARGKKPTVTAEDKRVLEAVLAFWRAHGRSPKLTDLVTPLGYKTPGAVESHLKALINARELVRDPTTGILGTPGQVRATPSLAQLVRRHGFSDNWLPAPAPNLTAWRAQRDGYGVLKGDILFFDPAGTAEPGDVVLALYRSPVPGLTVAGEIVRHPRPISTRRLT